MEIVLPTARETNKTLQTFLRQLGVPYSYSRKADLLGKIDAFARVLNFPWRTDQQAVIDAFLSNEKPYFVVNGIFGAGKTTLLLGVHVISVLKGNYAPTDAMFLSFNVSIRNELKQKLRDYGMSAKTTVRTFDSIIYEICKNYAYPFLDLPNYEGKRKFVYDVCRRIRAGTLDLKPLTPKKVLFIDECQDLETQTLVVFQTFFADAHILFAGDVFQSIQKEPKESLLWSLIHTERADTFRYCMKETPRVPPDILWSLKTCLSNHYPELHTDIDSWRSSSRVERSRIEWQSFDHYSDVFARIDAFLAAHEASECMILTFSSAITVRGNMGDLARIRRHLLERGQRVNENYKRMERGTLFLSTANSSKGLERRHVLLVSTFPLEKAFVNFSNDLVLNLVTVGISRAKESVQFLVPNYADKWSQTLRVFADCPPPACAKLRNDKALQDFTPEDYLNMDHSVTEIIKQGIVKYDTRIRLRAFVKTFETVPLFGDGPRMPAPKLTAEEDAAFVGILIENLITSTWTGTWPRVFGLEHLDANPMYVHCIKRIRRLASEYQAFLSRPFADVATQFAGIHAYTQVHVGMYNRIFMSLSSSTRERLRIYWGMLRPRVASLRPAFQMKIQSNLQMPLMTGICDAMTNEDQDGLRIWEIKASLARDWRDDALFQALLYALMTGKTWCRIILLNPFRNEKSSHYFRMKEIMCMRQWVRNDIQVWNLNCFLAKNRREKGVGLRFTNQYLLVSKEPAEQATLFHFVAPTKVDLLLNEYAHVEHAEARRRDLTRHEKLAHDSVLSLDALSATVHEHLQGLEGQIYTFGVSPKWNVPNAVPIATLLPAYTASCADTFEEGLRILIALGLQYKFV